MRQKAMDREATKLIGETKRKEKQDKQVRKAKTTMIAIEQIAERELTRQQ